MSRQVVREGAEAIRPHAQRNPVDPDLAALINAIELQCNALAAGRGRKKELLPIPADPSGQVGRRPLAGCIFAEWAFNTPVVGQVQRSPIAVVKIWRLGAIRIALEKFPLAVEVGFTLRVVRFGSFGKSRNT